jgi:hypothetical protein
LRVRRDDRGGQIFGPVRLPVGLYLLCGVMRYFSPVACIA